MGGGMSESPFAVRCDSHMLGCTGDAEPHPAPAKQRGSGDERGWDPSAKPPTAASILVFPRGSSGPHGSSDDGAKTPQASACSLALGHTRGQTFRITQPSLLQRPAPIPRARFSRCSASPGDAGGQALPCVAALALGSYANLGFSASSAASSRHGVAGCATARVYVHPAAHRPAGSDPACTACTGARLGKEKLEPYICPGQLSNVKHRTSPALVLLAAPAPRGKVLPARQSWDGLARSSMLPSPPALPSAPQPSGLGEPQGTDPAAVIAAVSMPHAPQGCSLLPRDSP